MSPAISGSGSLDELGLDASVDICARASGVKCWMDGSADCLRGSTCRRLSSRQRAATAEGLRSQRGEAHAPVETNPRQVAAGLRCAVVWRLVGGAGLPPSLPCLCPPAPGLRTSSHRVRFPSAPKKRNFAVSRRGRTDASDRG